MDNWQMLGIKILGKTLIVAFLIVVIVTFCIGRCTAQGDSITIDVPLGSQVNYMSEKARELDTTVVYLRNLNEVLVGLVAQGDSIINNLDSQNETFKIQLANMELANSSLLNDNILLRKENTQKSVVITDCEEEIKKRDVKIVKLRASRDNSIKSNIGMGTILITTLAVVIINSTK